MTRWIVIASMWLVLPAVGCTGGQRNEQQNKQAAGESGMAADTSSATMQDLTAVAILEPTEGNTVHGTVTFREVEGGVSITARIEGLSEGVHGFHIHETGDCSAPDASSAGGHFNPTGSPHGAPSNPPGERHVGDLGNITAGPMGVATYDHVDPEISLRGPNSIDGLAVVVHEGRDDLSSQPSGNAGPRVACGVIHLQPEGMEQTEGGGY